MITTTTPLAFLLIIPALAMIAWQNSVRARTPSGVPGDWRRIIEPALRATAVVDHETRHRPLADYLAPIIWFLLGLALAGPGIEAEDRRAYGNLSGRVIVLDLGSGTDIAAQRLATNRLLDQSSGVPTAIVVATADAFDVMPLTTDRKQIDRYLQVIDADLMPVGGRALRLALAHAEGILARASIVAGQVVLVTGGAPPGAEPSPDSGWLRAVVVVDSGRNEWQSYADAEGARLVDADRITPVATDLERALAHAARAIDRSRIDLVPWVVALAVLLWLGLFRRRLER